LDSDRDLLARVNSIDDFFGSILVRDTLDDWNLARDFGEFLVRNDLGSEGMGHLLMARAYRHLGNVERAIAEMKECQSFVIKQKLEPDELALFMQVLEKERKLLSAAD
jgi:hypothetical protein